jgi:hypothetical protein
MECKVCGGTGSPLATQHVQKPRRCCARAVSVSDCSAGKAPRVGGVMVCDPSRESVLVRQLGIQMPGVAKYSPLLKYVPVTRLGHVYGQVTVERISPDAQATSVRVTCPTLDPSIAMFGFASIATWPLTMLRLVNGWVRPTSAPSSETQMEPMRFVGLY